MPGLDDRLMMDLRTASVPTLVSTLYRLGFTNTQLEGVAPLRTGMPKMIGRAYTLRTIPIREDQRTKIASGEIPNLQAQAFNEAAAGDVFICSAEGCSGTALLGDMVCTAFMVRGVAGVVIDGGVNDPVGISALDFPVYHQGGKAMPFTSHRQIVDLNVPIGCGSVAVMPGDIVVGDANGVVAIPDHVAKEAAAVAAERERLEAYLATRLRDGAELAGTYPPNEATLQAYRDWLASK